MLSSVRPLTPPADEPGPWPGMIADLMIVLIRFRALPDEQMKHIDDFLKAGKPVIGLRTSTHGFNRIKGDYAKYNNGYKGPEKEWADGFGRLGSHTVAAGCRAR